MTKIVILGSGSFARESFDWVSQSGYNIVGFFSNLPSDIDELRKLPIYSDPDTIPKDAKWVVGSGSPKAIINMVQSVKNYIKPANAIIHSSCVIGTNVVIGDGSIICPGTIITCDVTIGCNTVVNLSCTVGHDCQVGSNVHLSPNVSLSGYSIVGDNSELGTGCVLTPKSEVPANSIIGASGVVTKKLLESGVYVGIPVRKIK